MVTPAQKIGPSLFAIDSFSGEASYIVDLAARTCSCPQFVHRLAGTNRGPCKHLVAVEAQAPMIEALEKARACSEAQVYELLPKYANDPVRGGALRIVCRERREALENEEKLKSIFA